MKIYHFILLFLLLPCIYSYETSKFNYEKSWYISGEVGTTYTLNATFLVNNSEQKVSFIELSEGTIIKKEDNLLFFSNGTLTEEEKVITASAIVETNYNPFLKNDVPLGVIPSPQLAVEEQAYSLLNSSSLAQTLISFTGWIHNAIEYDTAYSNVTDPKEVFEKRKGVCIAYASLLAYFLNYTNVEVKQVSGHSHSLIWLQHAWTEVRIGEQLVSVDPTYNQIGAISSDHIQTYVNDALTIRDTIYSVGDLHSFSSESEISQLYSEELEVPVDYSHSIYDEEVEVTLYNPTTQYIFVSYSFLFPEGWGENVNKILLLSPEEEIILSHEVEPEDHLDLDPEYGYNVPFMFSVMEEETEGELYYNVASDGGDGQASVCAPAFIFILFPLLLFWRGRLWTST